MIPNKIEQIALELEELSSLVLAFSVQFSGDNVDKLADNINLSGLDYIANTLRTKSKELFSLEKQAITQRG